MLVVTDDAATLINTLTRDALPSRRTGLRIVIDPHHDSLSMSLVEQPSDADTIVSHEGARVFLDRAASARLHTRTLRAAPSTERAAFFLND